MAGSRKQTQTPFEISKGLFMEETPRGAVRRWRDGNNVRWLNGLPQKMGGFMAQPLVNDVGDPATYVGKARSYLEWDSLDGQNWIAFGTQCKLYLVNNGVLFDITPIRKTSSIVNGFSTTNGSDIVTVTDPLHDAQEGDHVRFRDAVAVGGITINGEYDIITVVGLDTYTIQHSSNANATATGGGAVIAEYDISCGLETDGVLKGYGTSTYGTGTYGTEREDSTYGSFARVWSLDNWGEDLLASPNGDTLYWWERRLGPFSRAKVVSGAPANIEHMLVGPDNRHVIALGANTVSTGEQDRMFVRWCVGDDFEQWTASATNDAGSKRLDVGSRLISAVKSGRGILIASDKGIYWLSVVGGQDVYQIDFLGQSVKLIAKRAIVDVGGVIFFMGEDDFYVYDGALSILPCEVHSYVFGSPDEGIDGINRIAASKVQASYNKEFTEVWFEFAAGEELENNRVAIYNTEEKCWYVSEMARETRGDKNPYFGYPVAFSGGQMWLHENGTDMGEGEGAQPLVAFLESFEGDISDGSEMLVNSLVPDFKFMVGDAEVQLFGRNFPADERRETNFRIVSPDTRKVDMRFRARQVGMRIESITVGDNWRMGTWRLLAGPVGRR